MHHRRGGIRLTVGELGLLAIVPLLDAMVGYSSCVLVHGRFNDLRGLLPALDQCLNMLHGLRGKVLLAGFPAHSCRHVLDEEELAVMLQRVGYFSVNHRFLRHVTLSIRLPIGELDLLAVVPLLHRRGLTCQRGERPKRARAEAGQR